MLCIGKIIVFVLLCCVHIKDSSCNMPSHVANTTSADSSSSTVSNTHICKYKTSAKHLILTLFSVFIFFLGIAGNTLVIFVIQYSQTLRKEPGYLIICSLAAADLGVSFFVTTFKVDMYLKNGNFCHGIGLCVFIHVADTFFPIASITHLFVICINRFYAVTQSYNYHLNATHGREKLVVLGVWSYALLWTLLGMFSWDSPSSFYYRVIAFSGRKYCLGPNLYYHITLAIFIYIIPMTIATILYIIMLNIAMKKASDTPHPGSKQSTEGVKGLKTLVIVFAAYVVCWLPNFIVILIQYTAPTVISNFYRYSPETYDIVTTVISNVLPTINSAINPFIYFMMSDKFKYAFKDNLLKLLKKPRYADGMSKHDLLPLRGQIISNCSSLSSVKMTPTHQETSL